MKTYYIEYTMYDVGEIKGVCVSAKNKEEAYDKAVYETIPSIEETIPYAAWVSSVTYSNGKEQKCNTFAGKPY